MTEPIISARGITKAYPGVLALDDVSIDVLPHEVVGLVGENGSGKSTLLRILGGVERTDAGQILVEGKPVVFGSVRQAMGAGIGMVFQEQTLVPNLTVAENMFLGREGSSVRGGVYRWARLNARAKPLLERIGSPVHPGDVVSSLSFAQRQMVEVARALSCEDRSGRLLAVLLDEPTSVLGGDEIGALFAEISRLRATSAVLFVSHRLDEVLSVADRLYVMRNGRLVGERKTSQVSMPELHEMMVGRSLGDGYYREEEQGEVNRAAPPRVSVRNLGAARSFEGVTFDIAPGEILGLVGVEASGREAVARALCGIEKTDEGEVLIDGRTVNIDSPRRAAGLGVGYVPKERKSEGVLLGMSVTDNMTLTNMRALLHHGVIDHGRERSLVEGWIERLRIKVASPRALVGNLSGGNQQKIVLARWLMREDLKVLILDHPTRGLDIGAKAEVYELIRQLSGRGIAMVLLGDTLEECISLSHNIIAMKDGHMTAQIPAPAFAKPPLTDVVRMMM
jgi:ribose transport system ATP-binding protein